MTDWEARLEHYGTPVAIRTNFRHHNRLWWLTPNQHHILGHVVLYPKMGVRERARRLGVSPGTVSKWITRWCKCGILNRNDVGVFLQRGVTVPTKGVSTHHTMSMNTHQTKVSEIVREIGGNTTSQEAPM